MNSKKPPEKIDKANRAVLNELNYCLVRALSYREAADDWLSQIRSRRAKKAGKLMIDRYDMGLEWSQDEI